MTMSYTYTLPGLGTITVDRNGNITGIANAGFAFGALTASTNTESTVFDSVKEDELQSQVGIVPTSLDESPEKVQYIQIPADKLSNLLDANGAPVAISPALQIVPTYYYPTATGEQPPKRNKTSKKKNKGSQKKKSGNNGHASDRSYLQMVPPSYFNTRKQTTKSFFTPQASPEYLDAYFKFLNSYASNQNQESFIRPNQYGKQYNGYASQYDQTNEMNSNNGPINNQNSYPIPNNDQTNYEKQAAVEEQ